jgi:hypothetical protein
MKCLKVVAIMSLVAPMLMVVGCGAKNEVKPLSAKSKMLIKKNWSYDREASNTDALTKAGKATGIKNLKDIKLKGDVKKAADFLTAKTYLFAFNEKTKEFVYQVTSGKGMLKSKKTGYWKWNADETGLTLFKVGTKEKTGGTSYTIKELTDKKLVLQKEDSKLIQVFSLK